MRFIVMFVTAVCVLFILVICMGLRPTNGQSMSEIEF